MLALIGQFLRQHADALGARHENFVLAQQPLEFVQERGNSATTCLACSSQPAGRSSGNRQSACNCTSSARR